MRKKLSIMLAAITVMALMAAGPVVAQTPVVPPGVDCEIPENRCIPVCITMAIQGSGFDDLSRTGTVIVPEDFFLNVLEFFAPGSATRGPCPEGDGGGQQGGGQQGGGGGGAAPLELTQETEQEAESGDIDQSFEVSSTGDNSNQCASPQGVANTGNPQNVINLLQAGSETDDFEFEEVGSDITVSPTSETTCDQQVNQAASASG